MRLCDSLTESHHKVSEHLSFVPSAFVELVPRRASDNQDALPFDEDDPTTEPASAEHSGDIEDGRRRPGRPRVWASEAERKRAYRERLAAGLAEPDRLRKELRAERRTLAEKDGEVTRLKRDLARAEAAGRAALDRQADLQRMVEGLEAKVDDWRSRAQALANKREDDRAEREEIEQRRARPTKPKQRLELPNLQTKGRPPTGAPWRRSQGHGRSPPLRGRLSRVPSAALPVECPLGGGARSATR